ncbi:MAG: 3-deoxy-manno-octulosonate cytidylyltransferase [Burkholderiales bacterium]|jgi:3-deoxy-manno-octulosonate cytidylyltransferase (CMP-KDO synthetase)|nr:3-deoxy-manno-octulosonate cytidylyltransferase [Burkholderiales bacterium]
MSFVVIIPARYASTRLPGKPLADLGGIPMIVRVAERARQSHASRIIVATDDERVAHVALAASIETVMTRADHASGTDRIAEAIDLLGLPDNHIIVNVQGDEPFMSPTLIHRVAEKLMMHEDAAMATACHPITERADFDNPNIVKVALDRWGYASYFSRAPIPFARELVSNASVADWRQAYPSEHPPYRHYGIYAYRASFLRLYSSLSAAPTECIEKLEQLRALWHGYKICVLITDEALLPGIDTEKDLRVANEELLKQNNNNR